jgi:HEAT repeat protein
VLPSDSTAEDWIRWLASDDPDMRREAVQILGQLNAADQVAVSPFVDALGSTVDQVVFWATVTLGQLGERAKSAVPALCGIVKDYWQFGTRQAALSSLSRIAADDQSAKEAVLIAFGDVNAFVRRQALQAIIEFADLTPHDFDAIKKMEKDSDADVARWSGIALRNIRLRGSRGEIAG